MCTVTWIESEGGYDLFFNRDELRTRADESPPAEGTRNGVRFISPTDGQSGGTWLVTNEHGLTVCLLNDYASSWRPSAAAARASRGHVVAAMADATSTAEVDRRVRMQPLPRIAPFHLLALPAGGQPLLLQWNGAALALQWRPPPPPLLTSSSFATAEVIAARHATYRKMVRHPAQPTVSELARFHLQHDPSAGAHSISMSRPDASTRSTIHVAVDGDRIAFSYHSARADVNLGLPRNTPAVRIDSP